MLLLSRNLTLHQSSKTDITTIFSFSLIKMLEANRSMAVFAPCRAKYLILKCYPGTFSLEYFLKSISKRDEKCSKM